MKVLLSIKETLIQISSKNLNVIRNNISKHNNILSWHRKTTKKKPLITHKYTCVVFSNSTEDIYSSFWLMY